MYREYLDLVEELLEGICENQRTALDQGARMVCGALENDGLVYLFGCGHSHIMAEEGFYRAGGLGAVYPILQGELMLHEGAVKSSDLERRSILASEIRSRFPMSERDVLIVFSNSGINGLPVEMARLASLDGVPTIGVSSSRYRDDKSRHPDGLHLSDVCRLTIDTGAPHGDAAYTLDGTDTRMGPVSTLLSIYILNCLLARAAEMAVERGCDPSVYVSGNVPGGRERNESIIQKYRHRIRYM